MFIYNIWEVVVLWSNYIIINYNYIYRQITHSDFPIITNLILDKSKEKNQDQSQLQKNLSNNKTNSNLGLNNIKNKNSKNEKGKNDKNKNDKIINHEEIIIRSNKDKSNNSIIEVKLPNPYLNTECLKNNKYIDYNIKSKFKSKYAKYIQKPFINRVTNTNKSQKTLRKFDNHIFFTNISSNIRISKKHASEIY